MKLSPLVAQTWPYRVLVAPGLAPWVHVEVARSRMKSPDETTFLELIPPNNIIFEPSVAVWIRKGETTIRDDIDQWGHFCTR